MDNSYVYHEMVCCEEGKKKINIMKAFGRVFLVVFGTGMHPMVPVPVLDIITMVHRQVDGSLLLWAL